jgi:phosphohistidine phosphatase SixA
VPEWPDTLVPLGSIDRTTDDVAKVALIGHNPGLSDLIRYLSAEPGGIEDVVGPQERLMSLVHH